MALARVFLVAIAFLATAAGQPNVMDKHESIEPLDDVTLLQVRLNVGFNLSSPAPTAESFQDAVAESDAVDCGLMVLTTFFTKKVDWQRKQYALPEFEKMQGFYESARANGMNVTVLYDDLPEQILRYETDSFKFLKINFTEYDAEEGLNDVRFNMVRDVVDRNPSWQSIFLTDLFDVKIGRNPCGQMADGKLYVGKERGWLFRSEWMRKRFAEMGGKYMEFFNEAEIPWRILNAGLVGGRREVFTHFLKEMSDVLIDPDLTARKEHEQENVNMAAFNYVVRVSMGLEEDGAEGQPGWVSGPPVHSEYKKYQSDRTDVWFIHK